MGTMTLDDHITLAQEIKDAERLLTSISIKLQKHKKSGKSKKAYKLYLSLVDMKATLDTEYHALISDADFREHGHVYYGGHSGCD